MTIIGIDPGTASTGYAIIKKRERRKKPEIELIDWGVIKTDPSFSQEKRLQKLFLKISELLRKWRPKVMAIENIYFFKNLKTALPVSQARGVVLLAAARKNITVFDITPLQAKVVITGYGRADKKRVQIMLKNLLKLKENPKLDDAADALAVAICCLRILGKKPLTTPVGGL